MNFILKYSTLIVVLITFLSGLANHPDFEEKGKPEQKTFSVYPAEPHSPLALNCNKLTLPSLPFIPLILLCVACNTGLFFYMKRWADLSYKKGKIQILSARPHPPTLLIA